MDAASRSEGSDPLRLAASTTAVLLACGLAAQSLVWNHRTLVPVTAAVIGCGLWLALLPVVRMLVRRYGGARGGTAVALGSVVGAAVMLASLRAHLASRLESGLFTLDPDFARLIDEFEPDAYAIPLAFAITVYGTARWLERSQPRPPVLWRRLGTGSIVFAVALGLFGQERVARLPQVSAFFDRLPVVARVPRVQVPLGTMTEAMFAERSTHYTDALFGPMRVRRFHFASGRTCGLHITALDETPWASMTAGNTHPQFDCNEVVVVRDILRSMYLARPGYASEPVFAVRNDGNTRTATVPVNTATFARSIAPPRAYPPLALLGALVAFALARLPSRAMEHLRSRDRWRDALLERDGTVRIDGDPRSFRVARTGTGSLRPGPVVVPDVIDPAGGSYRDAPEQRVVTAIAGTCRSLESRLRGRMEAQQAMAFAIAIVCAIPLASAALCDLVFRGF